MLGQRLVAEYAKPCDQNSANELESKTVLERKVFLSKLSDEKKTAKELEDSKDPAEGMNSKLNIHHELPSHLHYKYPDPNIAILTNIANALACVPKFYTQVLHLMNKMNLPPPFGAPTPTPPVAGDRINMHDACTDTVDLHDFASSDESELESDADTQKHEIYKILDVNGQPLQKRKRLRTTAKSNQEKLNLHPTGNTKGNNLQSAFECVSSSKRVEFKLATSIKDVIEKRTTPAVSYNVFDERGEFGRIEPVKKDVSNDVQMDVEEEEEEEEDNESSDEESTDFVSAIRLKENRIPPNEILLMAQFKKYAPGDKTNRLYVKNLAKQVTEEDLKFIFKRFLRHCSDDEKTSLEIRLMQEGRMKGQAFITLPSEDIAERALRATHGYILHEKPMVIQFGRAGKK